jgi:sec-independent protein translocase protein TatA
VFNLGPLELFAIFIVALLVFGPEKLPEIGRQVGRAVREFRRIQSSFQADLGDVIDGHLTGPVLPGPAPTGAAEAAAPATEATPATPAPPAAESGNGHQASPPGDTSAKSEGTPPDAHQG